MHQYPKATFWSAVVSESNVMEQHRQNAVSRPSVPASSVSDFSTILTPKNRQDLFEGSLVGFGKKEEVCKTGRQNRKVFNAGLAAKQADARQVPLTDRTGGMAEYLAGKRYRAVERETKMLADRNNNC
jgi:hypothetical protein